MSLEERLLDEMKQAMKSNDKLRLSTIRMIRSALKNKEIEILKSFLPQPLSQEEILKIIDQSIQETQASSPKDIGKVMKSVMPKIGGKADGKLINQLVKERLSP